VLVTFVMIAVAHGLRRTGFFKDDLGATIALSAGLERLARRLAI